MTKKVFGVGINDSSEVVNRKESYIDERTGKKKFRVIWRCPFYQRWTNMLSRCYGKSYYKTQQTYDGCSVHPDWLYFSNFKSWMEQQDWEGKELDKDILIYGNREYGPHSCVFVSRRINNFIHENSRKIKQTSLPVGVFWSKFHQKYEAQCKNHNGKQIYLGRYTTSHEAHAVWVENKLNYAKLLSNELTDRRVADAIINRYEILRRNIQNDTSD